MRFSRSVWIVLALLMGATQWVRAEYDVWVGPATGDFSDHDWNDLSGTGPIPGPGDTADLSGASLTAEGGSVESLEDGTLDLEGDFSANLAAGITLMGPGLLTVADVGDTGNDSVGMTVDGGNLLTEAYDLTEIGVENGGTATVEGDLPSDQTQTYSSVTTGGSITVTGIIYSPDFEVSGTLSAAGIAEGTFPGNTVMVTGSGGVLAVTNDMDEDGNLDVSEGGTVTIGGDGTFYTDFDGGVSVLDGVGSSVTVTGALNVGQSGNYRGSLYERNSAAAQCGSAVIDSGTTVVAPYGPAQVFVSGSAMLTDLGDMEIGVAGLGSLAIGSDDTDTVDDPAHGYVSAKSVEISVNEGSGGTLSITGTSAMDVENSLAVGVGDDATVDVDPTSVLRIGIDQTLSAILPAAAVQGKTGIAVSKRVALVRTVSRKLSTGLGASGVHPSISTPSYAGLEVGVSAAGVMYISGSLQVGNELPIELGVNGGAGDIELDGSNAVLSATESEMTIGVAAADNDSSGIFNVGAGAVATVASADIAPNDDAQAKVAVTGSGAEWSVAGPLNIGANGNATMEVAGGGEVLSGTAELGETSGYGLIAVYGPGSFWGINGDLIIGGAGYGVMTVQQGAELRMSGETLNLAEGGDDALGVLYVAGQNALVSATDARLQLMGGGNSALEIIAGATLKTSSAEIGFTPDSYSVAHLMNKNSLWVNTNEMEIGTDGAGLLVIEKGAKVVSGPVTVGPQGVIWGAGSLQASVTNNGEVVAGIPNPVPGAPGPMPPENPYAVGGASIETALAPPPATTGTFEINGNYTQGPTGSLTLEIGGSQPGSYDQLVVDGTATISGTLNVSFANGYTATNKKFLVLSASSIVGTFTQVTGAEITYSPGGLMITPKPVPSPLSVAVNPAGSGTVTPGFSGTSTRIIGYNYVVKAIPSAGMIFAGWTGGATSGSATLPFRMEANLALTANFIPNPFPGVRGEFSGLASQPDAGDGLVDFSLSSTGGFTGSFKQGASSHPIKGVFDATGNWTGIIPNGTAPYTATLALNLTTGMVTGTISDSTGSYTVAAALTEPIVTGTSVAQSGTYTVVLSATASQVLPTAKGGAGYATLNVAPNGTVTFAGKLADGSVFTAAGRLHPDASFTFFSPLYAGANGGSLAGTVNFGAHPSDGCAGTLEWTKPRQKSGVYSSGLDEALLLEGSAYNRPASGERVLPFTNTAGNAIFAAEGGNLLTSSTDVVTLNAENNIAIVSGSNNLKLSFTTATGLMQGSFIPSTHAKPVKFDGVVDQEGNAAEGFFIDGQTSGAVLFKANP